MPDRAWLAGPRGVAAIQRLNHTRSDEAGTYRRKDQPSEVPGPAARVAIADLPRCDESPIEGCL
jgi:hypothetical protein